MGIPQIQRTAQDVGVSMENDVTVHMSSKPRIQGSVDDTKLHLTGVSTDLPESRRDSHAASKKRKSKV